MNFSAPLLLKKDTNQQQQQQQQQENEQNQFLVTQHQGEGEVVEQEEEEGKEQRKQLQLQGGGWLREEEERLKQRLDPVLEDMLSYPCDNQVIDEEDTSNHLLHIDSTAELLLNALKRNDEMGFPLTSKQIHLLQEISLVSQQQIQFQRSYQKEQEEQQKQLIQQQQQHQQQQQQRQPHHQQTQQQSLNQSSSPSRNLYSLSHK